jgi:hypothetical protein
MESAHVRELMQRDREHNKELRTSESDRINAILAENAGNVQRTAEVQAAQQQALATQVAASAEAVRTLMTATAATVAETLRTTVAPMQAKLEELSRAQYETQGQKQQVVETRSDRGETRMNLGAVLGGISVMLVLIFGVISLVIAYSHK